jgi:hypothetical protein
VGLSVILRRRKHLLYTGKSELYGNTNDTEITTGG